MLRGEGHTFGAEPNQLQQIKGSLSHIQAWAAAPRCQPQRALGLRATRGQIMIALSTANKRPSGEPARAIEKPGVDPTAKIGKAVAAESIAHDVGSSEDLSLEYWYFCGDGSSMR